MHHQKSSVRLRLARSPRAVSEVIRPNRLFLRLAELLHTSAALTEELLAAALDRVDAVPQRFTHEQLTAISPDILTLIETLVPTWARDSARLQLCRLLEEACATPGPA